MAINGNTKWEIRTTGADTNGGGIFHSGMNVQLTATSAQTASPVVSCPSYTFVSTDVDQWLFIYKGTIWVTGLYRIASVTGGNATLDAAVGKVLLYTNDGVSLDFSGYNTVAGCANTDSPTAGEWNIDYTQRDTPQWTGSNLTVDATTTTDVIPDGVTPGQNHIGSVIRVSGGSLTAGHYQILSIQGSPTRWRLDRAAGATSASGSAWALGGALASLGKCGELNILQGALTGTTIWIKAGTYNISSATANVAGGCWSNTLSGPRFQGYELVRGDRTGVRPLLKASGSIATFTMITSGSTSRDTYIENIDFDGTSYTSSRGLNVFRAYIADCAFYSFRNNGINMASGHAINCYAEDCATQYAFVCSAGVMYGCVAKNCLNLAGYSGVARFINCIAWGCGRGFELATGAAIINCIAYATPSGGNGIVAIGSGLVINTILMENTGVGISDNSGYSNRKGLLIRNCAFYNNTGGEGVKGDRQAENITLTANPFVSPTTGNFALNETAGGGAALRALGYPAAFPSISTAHSISIGAAEPVDPTNAEIAAAVWTYADRELTA
jgi:hypothetical protein